MPLPLLPKKEDIAQIISVGKLQLPYFPSPCVFKGYATLSSLFLLKDPRIDRNDHDQTRDDQRDGNGGDEENTASAGGEFSADDPILPPNVSPHSCLYHLSHKQKPEESQGSLEHIPDSRNTFSPRPLAPVSRSPET